MKKPGRDVPTGVFILAGLFFLRGFHGVIFGLLAILESLSTAAIMLALGALFILCGSWLISLQPRGWKLATAGSAVYLLLVLASISLGGTSAGLWYAVIAGIILVYLNMPATKRVFGR